MDLDSMVGRGEEILWRGKPDKKCFILEGIFNPMLPFAIIWLIFDLFFVGVSGGNSLILVFILIHMFPVWLYLAGIIGVFLKYKHTNYIVTNKAVYTSGGIFAVQYNTKPFAEMSRVNIHRGIFDQWIGVGDVIIGSELATNYYTAGGQTSSGSFGIQIEDIRDYEYVFNLVKTVQEDVYSDTQFPNAYRPEENVGYNTKYNGRGRF